MDSWELAESLPQEYISFVQESIHFSWSGPLGTPVIEIQRDWLAKVETKWGILRLLDLFIKVLCFYFLFTLFSPNVLGTYASLKDTQLLIFPSTISLNNWVLFASHYSFIELNVREPFLRTRGLKLYYAGETSLKSKEFRLLFWAINEWNVLFKIRHALEEYFIVFVTKLKCTIIIEFSNLCYLLLTSLRFMASDKKHF